MVSSQKVKLIYSNYYKLGHNTVQVAINVYKAFEVNTTNIILFNPVQRGQILSGYNSEECTIINILIPALVYRTGPPFVFQNGM